MVPLKRKSITPSGYKWNKMSDKLYCGAGQKAPNTVKSQIQTAVSIDYFVFENLKCASNQGRLLFIY